MLEINVLICYSRIQSDDDTYGEQSWSIRKTVQNLKITVVPDVTAAAGLDGRPFDATLSSEEYETLHALRANWMSCEII